MLKTMDMIMVTSGYYVLKALRKTFVLKAMYHFIYIQTIYIVLITGIMSDVDSNIISHLCLKGTHPPNQSSPRHSY